MLSKLIFEMFVPLVEHNIFFAFYQVDVIQEELQFLNMCSW